MSDAKDSAKKGGCGICTVIGLAIPISMAVMGGLHLDDCPAQHYIPIYLLVAGVVGLVATVIRVIGQCCQNDEGVTPMPIQVVSGVMGLFCLAWFIAGNVWIYGLHNKYSTVPTDVNYCDNTLYLFAFWVTTVTYILIGVSVVVGICGFLCCFRSN